MKKIAIVLALMASATTSVNAKTQHADWVSTKNDEGRCIAFASPQNSEGAINGRTAPYVTVMNSPKEGIRGAISFVSGAEATGRGDAKVVIDGESFEVLPFKDAAFAASGKPEAAVLSAMRKGRSLDVTWTTDDGQTVKDTYSLSGFTSAHNAIENCQ